MYICISVDFMSHEMTFAPLTIFYIFRKGPEIVKWSKTTKQKESEIGYSFYFIEIVSSS